MAEIVIMTNILIYIIIIGSIIVILAINLVFLSLSFVTIIRNVIRLFFKISFSAIIILNTGISTTDT